MPAKRPHRPLKFPEQYLTGSAQRAATAGDHFIVDIDGVKRVGLFGFEDFDPATAHFVIRDQRTGEIVERCKTCTASEVEHRVAVLNRGKPSRGENQRWGQWMKPGRTVKSSDPAQLSATEWVERLVANPSTCATLRAFISSQRTLSVDELTTMLTHMAESDRQLPDALQVDAISQQLARKFGVRRADDRR